MQAVLYINYSVIWAVQYTEKLCIENRIALLLLTLPAGCQPRHFVIIIGRCSRAELHRKRILECTSISF